VREDRGGVVNAVVTPGLPPDEREHVRAYLLREYAGVFGPAEVEFHLEAHVGYGFADYACQVVATTVPAGSRILDVGSGFGSFVLLARTRGFRAVGTEIASFEVAVSRRRVEREWPADDPQQVFLDEGISNSKLDDARFEAITFWNVLEHIEAIGPIVGRATGLLAPGGAIYVVCPNYASWRNEAHYQVPWHPFLTRAAAVRRLRRFGKDPRFFEKSVFPRTNWGVMTELARHGLVLHDRLNQRPLHVGHGIGRALFRTPRAVLDFFNPFRPSVELSARKPR
jgi:SAM-dependent methyltransferase